MANGYTTANPYTQAQECTLFFTIALQGVTVAPYSAPDHLVVALRTPHVLREPNVPYGHAGQLILACQLRRDPDAARSRFVRSYDPNLPEIVTQFDYERYACRLKLTPDIGNHVVVKGNGECALADFVDGKVRSEWHCLGRLQPHEVLKCRTPTVPVLVAHCRGRFEQIIVGVKMGGDVKLVIRDVGYPQSDPERFTGGKHPIRNHARNTDSRITNGSCSRGALQMGDA